MVSICINQSVVTNNIQQYYQSELQANKTVNSQSVPDINNTQQTRYTHGSTPDRQYRDCAQGTTPDRQYRDCAQGTTPDRQYRDCAQGTTPDRQHRDCAQRPYLIDSIKTVERTAASESILITHQKMLPTFLSTRECLNESSMQTKFEQFCCDNRTSVGPYAPVNQGMDYGENV